VPAFVGRTEPLARLAAAHQSVAAPPAGAAAGWAALVLVTGEAGIGMTVLLTRSAGQVVANGGMALQGARHRRQRHRRAGGRP
jgi:hypothetical protein